MLSQIELERATDALSEVVVGGRVERWVEPEPGRIAFSIYRRDGDERRKSVVELDARAGLAHVALLAKMPRAPERQPAFSAWLRAHLSRARLEEASLRGDDRQLALRLSAEEGEWVLLLSLFGRRSNLYVLDAEERLVLALRPLAETRAELELGAPWVDPAGRPPTRGDDRFPEQAGRALLEAIGAHYAGLVEERSEAEDRRRLRALLAKERKSAARRVARIEAELAEAEQASTLQRHGELLKANLARVEAGRDSVVARDFETGEPVEIPLDPKRSARENLEATFKRYQKLLRRLTKAGGQIDGARDQLARIESLESEVREAADLAPILARDDVRKLLSRDTPPSQLREPGPSRPALPAAYRKLPRRLHPRRYRSRDGLEIWVGRSDEGNDVLSTRLARGRDLFFHLDGAPGSHVVLRVEGGGDPPPESVLDACELAVHFSKQKNAGAADVHVVPIKNVKKPKGAKRGLVYVTGGKSIRLRREPARLERLQASRIED
jgi:predicted ribosome quality control (RQC) complex YloA/Tae2 family protein